MANDAVQSVGKRPNQTRVLVIMGSLIIVALLGVIVALVMNLNRGGETEEEPERRSVLITEENIEEVIDQIEQEEPVPRGMFEMSMNMDWYFPDGGSPSTNAYVANAASNTNDIYFDVTLSETDETIYESPVLPLGSSLRNFALDKDLDAGAYPCVCTYHLIDEQQRTLSTLAVAVNVIVQG